MLRISDQQRATALRVQTEQRCRVRAMKFKQEDPDGLAGIGLDALTDRLLRCVDRMAAFGIVEPDFLDEVFCWDLEFGEAFEAQPRFSRALATLQSPRREAIKFDCLRDDVEALRESSGDGI